MTEVLELCRTINPALALAAVVVTMYRMGETMMARPKQDRDLGLIFVGYVSATGLGSIQARLLGSHVGPITGVLTVLHLLLILRMLTWRLDREQAVRDRRS